MIAAYHSGGKLPNAAALSKQIDDLTAAPAGKKSRRKKTKSSKPDSGTEWTERRERREMAQAQVNGFSVFHVLVKIDPHCAMPIEAGNCFATRSPASVRRSLSARRPSLEQPLSKWNSRWASRETATRFRPKPKSRPLQRKSLWDLLLAAEPVPRLQGNERRFNRRFHPGKRNPPSASPPETPVPAAVETPSANGDASPALENILRVEAGRIDNVLNLVGELIIGKSMLQQALKRIVVTLPEGDVAGKVRRCHGLSGSRAQRSATFRDENSHGSGGAAIPPFSPHGARCRTPMRTRSSNWC